jgi:hypothetical protein
MRRLIPIGAVVFVLCGAAVVVYGGGWDIDMNYVVPFDFTSINICAEPHQSVHAFGEEHWHIQARKVLDDNGELVGWEVHVHSNHQNGKGIGTAIDENGEPILDDDGNPITVEYSVPGTYNFVKNLNKNEIVNEVFKCPLISHGSSGNLLVFFNRHYTIDENGEVEVRHDDGWVKCAGAGPDGNGPVDCNEYPDCCQP